MPETPDYVYQAWIRDAADEGMSAKDQRAKMIALLERIIELLEAQGRIRPS